MFRNKYTEDYYKNEFIKRFDEKMKSLELCFINNKAGFTEKLKICINSFLEEIQKDSDFEKIRYIAVNKLLTSLWIKEKAEYMFIGAGDDFDFNNEMIVKTIVFDELYKFFIEFYYEEKNEIKKYIGKVDETDIKNFLAENYGKIDSIFFSVLYFAVKDINVPQNIEYIFYGDYGDEKNFKPVYYRKKFDKKDDTLVRNIHKNVYKKLFYNIFESGNIFDNYFNCKIFYMMRFYDYVFEKISLKNSIIINTDFKRSKIKETSFKGGIINGCVIKNCELSKVDFSFINRKESDNYKSFAYPTVFENCVFNNVSFNEADLSYMIFKDNEYIDVSFENAAVNKAVFSGTGYEELNLPIKPEVFL